MKITRQNAGNMIAAGGCLLLLGAAVLSLHNRKESENAGYAARETYEKFIEQVKESPVKDEPDDIISEYGLPEEVREYLVNIPEEKKEDSEYEIDGSMYTAVMNIPALGLGLPVRSELTMSALKESPCRYSGSVKGNDIIIAAHNYDSHFGNIKSLCTGDEIILTDACGNETVYNVSETELLDGSDIENMRSGQWDLTLFTCNLSGRSRVTVRCIRKA